MLFDGKKLITTSIRAFIMNSTNPTFPPQIFAEKILFFLFKQVQLSQWIFFLNFRPIFYFFLPDVSIAFLLGILKEDVYMQQPYY